MIEPFEYIWMAVSLCLLALWLWRTDLTRKCFLKAPDRKYPLGIIEVLIVAFVFLTFEWIATLVRGREPEVPWTRQNIFILVRIGGHLITAGVIISLVLFRYRRGLRDFGLSLYGLPKLIPWALLYSITVFGLMFLALALTQWVCRRLDSPTQQHQFLQLLEKNPPPLSMFLLIVSPALVAPVLEELLFRGIMQTFFIGLFAPEQISPPTCPELNTLPYPSARTPSSARWAGILMTAGLFALIHGHWQHWPALFILGIGLGYALERYGSLWLPIMIHSLFNCLSLTVTLIKINLGG